MKNRKRVTEEDLRITEALIGESYCNLKKSVILAPSRAFKSVGETVCEHPYATAGTAVVAGAAIYGIIRMMSPPASARKSPEHEHGARQNDACRKDPMQEMLAMMIPLVTPYLAGYLQKYLGNFFSGETD